MENRGAKHRKERLADALRDEMSALLEGELGDPRIGLATVSELLLAPDGKSARIFIHAEGSEEEALATITGLNAAKGFIRHQLAERLGLRHAPEIFFHLDQSHQYGERIDQLLHRIEKRRKN
jgi:ribosome-binding factor A